MADSERKVIIGVDVGGTNTDAVLVQVNTVPPKVVSSAKCITTSDITTGIKRAVATSILNAHPSSSNPLDIIQLNIGTTHFVNAIVQRKNLARVAVIRLCGPASKSVPPFSDFNDNLRDCVNGGVFMVNGGYEFDGKVITEVLKSEIEENVALCVRNRINNFVVCGVFSPIKTDQEETAKQIILDVCPNASITLSSEIGQIGLLERENASILNECLKPLSANTIEGFRMAISDLGLNCPFFLTQNDGTVVSEKDALRQPVRTFASGPTNSMRGAAFLSRVKNGIVVDIGGTTTDIGILRKGFPREASSEVMVGGIRTNFRMPDIKSIGLGGGSYVSVDPVRVGPRSAGYNLKNEAIVFGTKSDMKDRRLTATDVAVAAKLCHIGSPGNVSHIHPIPIIDKIREMVEEVINQMKVSGDDMPVILVGGGTILLGHKKGLHGASEVFKPDYHNVANAVGAALSQVSGSVDKVYSMSNFLDQEELSHAIQTKRNELGISASKDEIENAEKEIRRSFYVTARERALEEAQGIAVDLAVDAGASRADVELAEKNDTPLSYLPGNATRIQIKVVGDLNTFFTSENKICDFAIPTSIEKEDVHLQEKQTSTATGEMIDSGDTTEIERDPEIDSATGEWVLSTWDVECIGLGAGILGCGGGGSPYLGRLLAKMAIQEGKRIRIITKEKLLERCRSGIVVPVAAMGAPLITTEKLACGEVAKSLSCLQQLYKDGYRNGEMSSEFNQAIESESGITFIQNYEPINTSTGSKADLGDQEIVALTSAEVGGLNCIEPLLVSAELGIPVLDADGMGRAFPELQMDCSLIYGVKPYPATLADDKGRKDVVLKVDDAKTLEDHFRRIVVEMGCSAGVTLSSIRVEDELDTLIHYSISYAWRLGRAVLRSRRDNTSPTEAIRNVTSGFLTIVGKISDVCRETTGGFNKGMLKIDGTDNFSDKKGLIEFQNENLIARIGTKSSQTDDTTVVSCVPDLITVVDSDTGEPIPTENVRYGQRVTVLTIPSHQMLRTPRALAFIGPRAFGYKEIEFSPCGPCPEIEPVGPR
ncbi:uncharacterized protein LOC132553569 [Ylistrum balloti]|uniref:uncharacterized protein LOC132553569 n=1 Tax=Ylistrum balloti TaxID=509963 RepID=UPI002905DC48|nr:uncharacterized protein LOC132553569 [Ylistrum balloti]